MNSRVILVAVATAILLSGCDIGGYGLVLKSALEQVTLERDKARKELEALKKTPPKSEEVLVAPSAASCKPLIDVAVANKICPIAPVAPAKKPVVKKQPTKPSYINKEASGGKTLPNPGPVTPAATTARAPGGCIYESDGNLILKGEKTPQPKGKEVARIADDDLKSKYPKLVGAFPEGFVTNAGHKAMCFAWSKLVAMDVQSAEGRRVNDDTHRTQ